MPLCFSIFTLYCLPSTCVSVSSFIISVPMRKCLEKHSCTSSTISISILNGTCFFYSSGIDFVLVGDAIKLNPIIIITLVQ